MEKEKKRETGEKKKTGISSQNIGHGLFTHSQKLPSLQSFIVNFQNQYQIFGCTIEREDKQEFFVPNGVKIIINSFGAEFFHLEKKISQLVNNKINDKKIPFLRSSRES